MTEPSAQARTGRRLAGACAERGEKSRRVRVGAAAVGCRAGTARVLFFCERFLLHTKRKCSDIDCVSNESRG